MATSEHSVSCGGSSAAGRMEAMVGRAMDRSMLASVVVGHPNRPTEAEYLVRDCEEAAGVLAALGV